MKKIIHISPALPPVINGLGDFCDIVVRNLEKAGYTDNVFILRRSVPENQQRNIHVFAPETFRRVLDEHKADVVILHYVNYAYDRNGLPFYIVNGLRNYKRRVGCRLLVFFHELYATSKSPFKLPFYTDGLQKAIVKDLWNIADTAFTSCNRYKELLQKIVGDESPKTVCTGVFSNVPDDLYDHLVDKEERSVVVFGSHHNRKAVYDHPLFSQVLETLGANLLYDIGPGENSYSHPKVEVKIKGPLPAKDLAVYLNKAKYGLLRYTPGVLGKSGIFSAYAAYGVIPFNLPDADDSLSDGLVDGKNYFSIRSPIRPDSFKDDSVREELLKWYRGHNQEVVSDKIRSYL